MKTEELINFLNLKVASLGMTAQIEPLSLALINEAYVRFVSIMEGVSDQEEIDFSANEGEVAVPSYILKVKSAWNADGEKIEIVNRADTDSSVSETGTVEKLILGVKQGFALIEAVPEEDQTIYLDVDRLPKKSLNLSSSLSDVPAKYQMNVIDTVLSEMLFMKGDPRAAEYETRFVAQALDARRNKARLKSKPVRVVRYGGIL